MAKKIMFSFELEPGMIVAEDVFRSNGSLLFPKHTMLNELMIAKLPLYNIMELPIEDGPIEKPDIDIAKLVELAKSTSSEYHPSHSTSYSQKVKESQEFKKFTEDYTVAINNINSKINNFVSGTEALDTDALVSNTLSLMEGNTIHVFDMLHNMQAHDDAIYEHSTNVAIISATIGRWLGLPEEDIYNLTISGLLHDLGKMMIPTELLNKPDVLNGEEFEVIKTHPMQGYTLIKELPLNTRIKEACLLHHERCDGSGYPFGLKGDKISPYAKIVAIADVYDAMTSPRSYRPAYCPFAAIQFFEKEGLYKYDPKFIMTFLENIGASYLNNHVRLSDGRTGEIVLLNKMCLSRPMIKCGDDFIDLTKNPELSIDSLI